MVENNFKMAEWGPYSKKYMGISKIISSLADEGARFDFIAHPTLWNSATPVPLCRQIITCGIAATITHFFHIGMNLCGKMLFMPMFLFQKLMTTHIF